MRFTLPPCISCLRARGCSPSWGPWWRRKAEDSRGTSTSGSAVCILVVFLTLFFLRVVDEWKDFDYDKVHKPDKPLVQGVVTHGQLFTYLRVTALLTLGLSAWLSWTMAVIVALDMAWGLFLVSLERMSRVVRENVFVNLLVTYPVNVALSVCVYVFFLEQYGVAPSLSGVLLIGGFAVAFLSYEFLRKAVWPHLAEPGERVYATVVGGYGAIGLCVGAAATGCALVISVLLSQSGSGWGALLVAGSLAAPAGSSSSVLAGTGPAGEARAVWHCVLAAFLLQHLRRGVGRYELGLGHPLKTHWGGRGDPALPGPFRGLARRGRRI